MTVLVYQSDGGSLEKTRSNYSLAGYNLVHRIWETRGRPIDRGWQISHDDLISNYDPSTEPERAYSLLIGCGPDGEMKP